MDKSVKKYQQTEQNSIKKKMGRKKAVQEKYGNKEREIR